MARRRKADLQREGEERPTQTAAGHRSSQHPVSRREVVHTRLTDPKGEFNDICDRKKMGDESAETENK